MVCKDAGADERLYPWFPQQNTVSVVSWSILFTPIDAIWGLWPFCECTTEAFLHMTDTGLTVYCIETQKGVPNVLLHFLVHGFHDNMHVYVLCFFNSTVLRCLT